MDKEIDNLKMENIDQKIDIEKLINENKSLKENIECG